MPSIPEPHPLPSLEAIPEPQAVRDRLGEVLLEADLLRSLLRLAEKAAKARARASRQKGGGHDA